MRWRSRRATRSTDPNRSAWWFVPPVIGATLGVIAPLIAKLKTSGSILVLIGLLLTPAILLHDWVSRVQQDRNIAKSAKIELFRAESSGICKFGKKFRELWIRNSDHSDSEFPSRNIRDKLIRNIKSHTPTLIVGPSMSGKTRLVVDIVRKNYPSTPVWFPKGDDDIRHLIGDAQSPRRGSIIILDDVDRFLSNQTLSLGQLDVWIRGSCIIIATMMESNYRSWRDEAENKSPGWDVVNRFTILQMEALLTEHEKTALLSSSYEDLAVAVEKVGLAPLLGGAPAVRQRLKEGLKQHLWGYALVRAAADWRRVGLGPATKTQIQEVALTFKDDIAWGEPNWKKAWKWASMEVNDTVSLIRQTGSREWEVLDLVADEADWPLSQQTLEAMAGTEHSPRQALAISLTMHKHGTLDRDNPVVNQTLQEADIFLYKLTTESTFDPNLLNFYIFFLIDILHNSSRAEKMYEQAIAVNPDHANILGNYANFLWVIRHDFNRAQNMYQRAIKANPNHARNFERLFKEPFSPEIPQDRPGSA